MIKKSDIGVGDLQRDGGIKLPEQAQRKAPRNINVRTMHLQSRTKKKASKQSILDNR